MKMKKYSEGQIVRILKEYEAGKQTRDICREYGISKATFYNWKKKYGGMDAGQLKRLKELEAENRRLKHMYADLSLDHELLKEILEKKF
jgi:putative transposase